MRFQGLLGLMIMATLGFACGSDSTETEPGAPCGPVNCAVGEYCCDAECGLCIEQEVACEITCEDTTA